MISFLQVKVMLITARRTILSYIKTQHTRPLTIKAQKALAPKKTNQQQQKKTNQQQKKPTTAWELPKKGYDYKFNIDASLKKNMATSREVIRDCSGK